MDEESGYTSSDWGRSKLLKRSRYGKKFITGPYQTVRYKGATSNVDIVPKKGWPEDVKIRPIA